MPRQKNTGAIDERRLRQPDYRVGLYRLKGGRYGAAVEAVYFGTYWGTGRTPGRAVSQAWKHVKRAHDQMRATYERQ
jgi:hypothetical protein